MSEKMVFYGCGSGWRFVTTAKDMPKRRQRVGIQLPGSEMLVHRPVSIWQRSRSVPERPYRQEAERRYHTADVGDSAVEASPSLSCFHHNTMFHNALPASICSWPQNNSLVPIDSLFPIVSSRLINPNSVGDRYT